MLWSGEVLAHAVILASPLAACYGAQLLARLLEQMEETRRGVCDDQPLPLRGASDGLAIVVGVFGNDASEFEKLRTDCFQYSNATFKHQDSGRSGSEDMEFDDEDELDFCILTPQQALGALGEHAPQYAKIFVNGSTFVADKSEPGMMLSVEEYADRMHESACSLRQSARAACLSTIPILSDRPSLGLPASSAAPLSSLSGRALTTLSARSDSSTWASLSSASEPWSDCSSFPMVSVRSSFEVSVTSHASHSSLQGLALSRRAALAKDSGESSHCCTPPQICPKHSSSADEAKARLLQPAAGVAVSILPAADLLGPVTPREVTMSSRCTSSDHSSGGATTEATPHTLLVPCPSQPSMHNSLGGQGHKPAKMPTVVGSAGATVCSSSRRIARSPNSTTRSASYGGGVASCSKSCQRRWVPSSSARSGALQPPVLSRVGTSMSSSSRKLASTQNGSVPSCSDLATVPHSPPQRVSSRSLCSLAPSGSPSSPSILPVGLSKAPALPLPSGATFESTVPPALKYYLAQSRAAQGVHEARDSAERRFSDGGLLGSLLKDAEGSSADISTSHLGFVRKTVEQLNTQRLLCCHVTPFAAAKTSPKLRTLAHRDVASAQDSDDRQALASPLLAQ